MTAATISNLEGLVRRCIDDEDAADWALARRVPSTYTWRTLAYLRSLDRARRDALYPAFVANALFFFNPSRDPAQHAARSGHPEYKALVDALPHIAGWEYTDVRTLRAILSDQMSKRPSPEWANTPAEVLERARTIRPTKAGDIRKVVKQLFQEKFGGKPIKGIGGEWKYPGSHHGREFTLSIDYGSWDQLRYHVHYNDPASGMMARELSYERLVGAGLGQWDSLTADNLEENIALLCELVEKLVELPDRLVAMGAT